jgi:LPS-assembly lipoprotein
MTPMPKTVRSVLIALAALAAVPLAGCGFTPLYATPGMTPALEAVDVIVERRADPSSVVDAALQTRVRFLLREQLDDELGRKGGLPARYQLLCTTKMIRIPRGVRVNNVANRYEINLTVNYTLTAAGGTKVLLQGSAPVIAEYDSADAPYAGVAAEQDGENRAANQAAIAIRLALARYFAGVHSGSHAVETPLAGQTSLDSPD